MTRLDHKCILLSPAQGKVLVLTMAQPGLTAKQQAERLNISPRMLDKRRQQICKRFATPCFAGAVAAAVRGGWAIRG